MKSTRRFSFCSGRMLMIVVVAAVLVSGCALRPTVTGKWQDVKGPATVHFEADGVFHAVDSEGMAVSGTYRLTSADGIQFEVDYGEAQNEIIQARMILEEDRMVLIFSEGDEVETYRRLP